MFLILLHFFKLLLQTNFCFFVFLGFLVETFEHQLILMSYQRYFNRIIFSSLHIIVHFYLRGCLYEKLAGTISGLPQPVG